MQKLLFMAGGLLISTICSAQLSTTGDTKDDIFVFPVTDYMVVINDSMKVVQFVLPDGFGLRKGQAGALVNGKKNDADTARIIGTGKCSLIKGNYNYFTIKYKTRPPQKGDLLYTALYYPAKYPGRIYELTRNCIYIKISSGDSAYDFKKAMYLDTQSENSLLKILLDDIHYVAKEMKKQNDSQDQLVKDGMFKGKKLFDAMENSTGSQLNSFLDYIIARPGPYTANAWSISEIFATWMVGGTPTVIKSN